MPTSLRKYYFWIGKIAVKTVHVENYMKNYIGLMISDDYELMLRITAGLHYTDLSSNSKIPLHLPRSKQENTGKVHKNIG